MSTASGSDGSDGSGGEMDPPQLKRSREAHHGVPIRRATAVRQAGGAIEDVQATCNLQAQAAQQHHQVAV